MRMTSQQADNLTDLLDDLLLAHKYMEVDTLLWAFRESLDIDLLAIALDITYTAKEKLPNWQVVKKQYNALVLHDLGGKVCE
jgi:hypothetical protein